MATKTKKTKPLHAAKIFRRCNVVLIHSQAEDKVVYCSATPVRIGESSYDNAKLSDNRFVAYQLIKTLLGREFATVDNIKIVNKVLATTAHRAITTGQGLLRILTGLTYRDKSGCIVFPESPESSYKVLSENTNFVSKSTSAHAYKFSQIAEEFRGDGYVWADKREGDQHTVTLHRNVINAENTENT